MNDLVEETKGKSIMLDRAENLLHDRFGDEEYWAVRYYENLRRSINDCDNTSATVQSNVTFLLICVGVQ